MAGALLTQSVPSMGGRGVLAWATSTGGKGVVYPGCLVCGQLKQLAVTDTCVATAHGELTPCLCRCWLRARLNPGEGTSTFQTPRERTSPLLALGTPLLRQSPACITPGFPLVDVPSRQGVRFRADGQLILDN